MKYQSNQEFFKALKNFVLQLEKDKKNLPTETLKKGITFYNGTTDEWYGSIMITILFGSKLRAYFYNECY